MTQYTPQDRAGTMLLEQVHEGMKVFDRNDKEVGKVKFVFFGAAADELQGGAAPASNAGANPDTQTDSLVKDIAMAFTDADDLPEALRSRLIHNGFIRIDTSGWFSKDSFAMPDQIETVADDKVTLNTTMDELMKR